LILFGFLPQNVEDESGGRVDESVAYGSGSAAGDTRLRPGELDRFRWEFYRTDTAGTGTPFELTDAVLCADGPVRSLVELTLAAEHGRGHGAMYDALAIARLPRNDCVGRCGSRTEAEELPKLPLTMSGVAARCGRSTRRHGRETMDQPEVTT
jgi:hypothetical protein